MNGQRVLKQEKQLLITYIQKLLLEVKGQIARSYNYKNQYLKRITDFIPKERFDLIYDNYMVKAFDFPNPMKESEEKINDRN